MATGKGAPGAIHAYSMVVEQIYDAAVDPAAWHGALEAMRSALGGEHVVAIIRPDSVGSEGLAFTLNERFYVLRDFLAGWLPSQAKFPSGPTEVSAISERLTVAAWHATDFYRELCEHQDIEDILSIDLTLADRSAFRLRFTRPASAGRFGSTELDFARALVPHLRRAMRIDQKFAREGVIHRSYVEACDRLGLATFILDEQGAVLESNGYAHFLLGGGGDLQLRNGKLVARHGADNRALQAVLKIEPGDTIDVANSDPQALRLRGSEGTGLNILVRRVDDTEGVRAGRQRPASILFARDPNFHLGNDARIAQRLFNLTQAESALAIRLANGLTLPEAAADLQIQHSTARTHLRAVFAKTGTSRQSSLVRHLLNSVSALTDSVDGANGSGDDAARRSH
jgi:DNA-binding CsgD family transcriptional regulator